MERLPSSIASSTSMSLAQQPRILHQAGLLALQSRNSPGAWSPNCVHHDAVLKLAQVRIDTGRLQSVAANFFKPWQGNITACLPAHAFFDNAWRTAGLLELLPTGQSRQASTKPAMLLGLKRPSNQRNLQLIKIQAGAYADHTTVHDNYDGRTGAPLQLMPPYAKRLPGCTPDTWP